MNPAEEAYFANCLIANDKGRVPSGFTKTFEIIKSRDYDTMEMEMSEFRKIDGGLTPLSLRF